MTPSKPSRLLGFLTFFALLVGGSAFGEVPQDLIALKSKLEASPGRDTEAGRQQYIVNLIHLWEKYMVEYLSDRKSNGGDKIRAVDLEIAKHPAPKDLNPSPNLLLGDWESPRHGYRYTQDGKWIMLPEDICTTHGKWKITNNAYFQSWAIDGDKIDSATGSPIYLLNHDYFVFGDHKGVYIEKRVPYGTYGVTPKSAK
jgi:hypothetical protein